MPAKKADAPPDPNKARHVQFTSAFVEEYQNQFKRKYVHQGPKDGSPLKHFLIAATDVTVEDWRWALRRTWNGRDKWRRENCTSIAMVTSQWASIVVAAGNRPECPLDPIPAPDAEIGGVVW